MGSEEMLTVFPGQMRYEIRWWILSTCSYFLEGIFSLLPRAHNQR